MKTTGQIMERMLRSKVIPGKYMFRFLHKLWSGKRNLVQSTRLLGNAGLPGHEDSPSIFSKHSSLERAAFGKYDTPFFRRIWVRLGITFFVIVLIIMLIIEVINGLVIFD